MDEKLEQLKQQTGGLAATQTEREITAIQTIREIVDELGGEFSHVGAALKGFSDLAYHNIETQSYDTPFYFEERASLLKLLDNWRTRADELLNSRDSIVEYYSHKADKESKRVSELLQDNDALSEKYKKCQLLMDFITELNETPS